MTLRFVAVIVVVDVINKPSAEAVKHTVVEEPLYSDFIDRWHSHSTALSSQELGARVLFCFILFIFIFICLLGLLLFIYLFICTIVTSKWSLFKSMGHFSREIGYSSKET